MSKVDGQALQDAIVDQLLTLAVMNALMASNNSDGTTKDEQEKKIARELVGENRRAISRLITLLEAGGDMDTVARAKTLEESAVALVVQTKMAGLDQTYLPDMLKIQSGLVQ